DQTKHFDDVHADRPGTYTVESWSFADYTSLKTVERQDDVRVEFCRQHCGHEQEPALLTMDAKSEAYIISLLKEGFKTDRTLKKVRETSKGKEGTQTRIYYTTSRDIRNFAIRNNLDSARIHNVDVESAAIRVRESNPDDGIKLYTPSVNETGERVIGLSLSALSSYRMTEKEVLLLFNEIKKVLPRFDNFFFMIDDTNTFLNGFCKRTRGLRDGRHRLQEHYRAHSLAVKVFSANRSAVRVVDEGRWKVKNSSGDYFVDQVICIYNAKVKNHCIGPELKERKLQLNSHCQKDSCNAFPYGFRCECTHDSGSGVSCVTRRVPDTRETSLPVMLPDDLPSTSTANQLYVVQGYAIQTPICSIRTEIYCKGSKQLTQRCVKTYCVPQRNLETAYKTT
ncbi:hypothetical protein NECAME_09851, partial [Necator americanus]